MKYKTIFYLSILSLLAACSQTGQTPVTKIHINYSSYSSLDESKTTRSGILAYVYDTALYYNLMSSDSMLYYNHKNGHGILNLKTNTVFKTNELDETNRPAGVFESELIPLFLTDTSYISDLEKDTAITFYKKTAIGNVVLLEHYSDLGSHEENSLGQCENERVFLCYDQLTHKIYFQLTVLKINISGISFIQKDWLHLSYMDNPSKTLNEYNHVISTAREYKNSPALVKPTDSLTIIPDFTYSDLTEKRYRSADIQQSYALLEFWYLSCAPCLKNMQHLNALYVKYKDRDIKFLVLNDSDQDVEKLKKIHDKYKLRYDVYYHGENLKKALDIQIHPHTIIYNTLSSKIVYEAKGTGNTYVQEIEHVLDSLLNAK